MGDRMSLVLGCVILAAVLYGTFLSLSFVVLDGTGGALDADEAGGADGSGGLVALAPFGEEVHLGVLVAQGVSLSSRPVKRHNDEVGRPPWPLVVD